MCKYHVTLSGLVNWYSGVAVGLVETVSSEGRTLFNLPLGSPMVPWYHPPGGGTCGPNNGQCSIGTMDPPWTVLDPWTLPPQRLPGLMEPVSDHPEPLTLIFPRFHTAHPTA
jgi:hypothetical protein